jgi:hypothetical protein
MKRIVCLILAITCVFALFSCGGKVNLDEVVAKATPTKVVTIVEYVAKSGETLTSEYVTEHDTKNGISAISYIYERFGEIELGDVERIVTLEGKVYYKNGEVSHNEGDTWTPAEDVMYSFTFNIDQKYFDTYTYSEDGKVITATVSPENAERVFGFAISATGAINVTFTTNRGYLYGVDVSYTTEAGANVVVRSSYDYAAITLAEQEPEADE